VDARPIHHNQLNVDSQDVQIFKPLPFGDPSLTITGETTTKHAQFAEGDDSHYSSVDPSGQASGRMHQTTNAFFPPSQRPRIVKRSQRRKRSRKKSRAKSQNKRAMMTDYYAQLTPQAPALLTPLQQLPHATRSNLDSG
jgi:hypothetical protein